jgi:hypothetical protein
MTRFSIKYRAPRVGPPLVWLNQAGPDRNRDSLDSRPDPELRSDLFQIAIDRAGGQSEDAADVARTFAAANPDEAFEFSRAQGEALRSDVCLTVWCHEITRL